MLMAQINVNSLTFSYEGSYDNIFENVSFQFDSDWKLGFTGRNGRGKTTFLNLLQGKYEYSGTIASSLTFDYFPFSVPHAQKETWQAVAEWNPDCELWRLERELNQLEVDGKRELGRRGGKEWDRVVIRGVWGLGEL